MPCSYGALPASLAAALRTSGAWKEHSPVALSRLSRLQVSYFDFEQIEHTDGEIIVLDAVAHRLATIFDALHAQAFPIAKMRSVHHYQANDELSMEDNNSSCFCDRPIEGTTLTSLHSYGLAVDLNPVQNPFIVFDDAAPGKASIYPPSGWEYVNRHNKKPGMVEDLVQLFFEHGFIVWGGRWTTPIDYHHFQVPRGVAELLTVMTPADAKAFFEICVDLKSAVLKIPAGEKLRTLVTKYETAPQQFLQNFGDLLAAIVAVEN